MVYTFPARDHFRERELLSFEAVHKWNHPVPYSGSIIVDMDRFEKDKLLRINPILFINIYYFPGYAPLKQSAAEVVVEPSLPDSVTPDQRLSMPR